MGKRDRERERKRSAGSLLRHKGIESFMYEFYMVSEAEHLGHCPVSSQAISRKVDQKWNNQHPYGIPTSQAAFFFKVYFLLFSFF